MLRVTVRFAVRRVCLAALIASLIVTAACGSDSVRVSNEPWPLTLGDPAVLGYIAVQPTEDELSRFMAEAFDWAPDGLDAESPVVIVHFDQRTYGGGFGVLFPLRDEPAFRASLAAAPSLESLGGDRYRLSIPPESMLGTVMAVFWRMQGASPLSALSALRDAGSSSFPLQVDVRGQHALFAPSLEALGVCNRLLRETSGFVDAPRESLVLSFDLGRMRVGHAEEIRKSEEQLRNLISGVRSGGALMGMMAMASRESSAPSLPVNWEMVWALKEMLAVGEMDALQLRGARRDLRPAPPRLADKQPTTDDSSLDLFGDWLSNLSIRLAFSVESRMADVLETLSSGAGVEGAEFTLRVDPKRFPRAFAEWCRPLAEVVKGEGPPCDRYLDELVDMLSHWSGLLALRVGADDHPMLLLGMSSETAVDNEAITNWLKPLLSTARIEGLGDVGRVETMPDGRQVFMNAQGEPTLTVGRSGVVLWIARGGSAPPDTSAVLAVEAALAAGEPDGVPGLRFSSNGIDLELSVRDRELELGFRVGDSGR
jgi:hypothetical protein